MQPRPMRRRPRRIVLKADSSRPGGWIDCGPPIDRAPTAAVLMVFSLVAAPVDVGEDLIHTSAGPLHSPLRRFGSKQAIHCPQMAWRHAHRDKRVLVGIGSDGQSSET